MLKKSLLLILTLSTFAFAQNSYIHHQITANVNPESHFIEATDKITIPADQFKTDLFFLMVSDLKVKSETPGVTVKLDKSKIKAKDFGMDQEDFETSSSITQNKYKVIFKNNVKLDLIKGKSVSVRCDLEFNGDMKDMKTFNIIAEMDYTYPLYGDLEVRVKPTYKGLEKPSSGYIPETTTTTSTTTTTTIEETTTTTSTTTSTVEYTTTTTII